MAPPSTNPVLAHRVVIVTRKSRLQWLIERHGTQGQAEFFLRTTGKSIAPVIEAHERFLGTVAAVRSALAPEQRRAEVDRDDLSRFLFQPNDIVVIVGQDGLVPNTAKYLTGQVTVGINPDSGTFDGVLCPHSVANIGPLLLACCGVPVPGYQIEERAMARVERDDGQTLVALNEIYLGHATHQSARYTLRVGGNAERQSSSGIIVSTGTGASGWARSICAQRATPLIPPAPTDRALCWMVREPFPSVSTGTTLNQGILSQAGVLEVESEMQEGGVVFADGIEPDYIQFLDGSHARVTLAERGLRLLMPRPRM